MKKIFIFLFLLFFILITFSQEKGGWIGYPDDFEIWLHNEVSTRRKERFRPYPAFWREGLPYGVVCFEKSHEIGTPDTIKIHAERKYQIKVDGKIVYDFDPSQFILPSGKHTVNFLTENWFVNCNT